MKKMTKITTIEKDCFYHWITKPENGNQISKEILIGNSVGKLVKETGMAKFKKFFEKDLKRERSVAYRYEKRFKKEPNSKWFIISLLELTKNRVQGCKSFDEITQIEGSQFCTTKNIRPFKKKHYFYIVTF